MPIQGIQYEHTPFLPISSLQSISNYIYSGSTGIFPGTSFAMKSVVSLSAMSDAQMSYIGCSHILTKQASITMPSGWNAMNEKLLKIEFNVFPRSHAIDSSSNSVILRPLTHIPHCQFFQVIKNWYKLKSFKMIESEWQGFIYTNLTCIPYKQVQIWTSHMCAHASCFDRLNVKWCRSKRKIPLLPYLFRN